MVHVKFAALAALVAAASFGVTLGAILLLSGS
jgi:hypothetical protein